MPNIITPKRFVAFMNILMEFILQHNLEWIVTERSVSLSEEDRRVAIIFSGTLYFYPETSGERFSQITMALVKALGDVNGDVTFQKQDQTKSLDLLIAYREDNLSDRQIAEFKEKRSV